MPEYDRVALTWVTRKPSDDHLFMAALCRLCEDGWESELQASLPPKLIDGETSECMSIGGACILRRPKGQYEYAALQDETEADWTVLLAEGWSEERCVNFSDRGGTRYGHIHLLRRQVSRSPMTTPLAVPAPQDPPRMWRRSELQKLMWDARAHDVLMGDESDQA